MARLDAVLLTLDENFSKASFADVSCTVRQRNAEIARDEFPSLNSEEVRVPRFHLECAARIAFLVAHFARGSLEHIKNVIMSVGVNFSAFSGLQHHLPQCKSFVFENLFGRYIGHGSLLSYVVERQ